MPDGKPAVPAGRGGELSLLSPAGAHLLAGDLRRVHQGCLLPDGALRSESAQRLVSFAFTFVVVAVGFLLFVCFCCHFVVVCLF